MVRTRTMSPEMPTRVFDPGRHTQLNFRSLAAKKPPRATPVVVVNKGDLKGRSVLLAFCNFIYRSMISGVRATALPLKIALLIEEPGSTTAKSMVRTSHMGLWTIRPSRPNPDHGASSLSILQHHAYWDSATVKTKYKGC